MYYVADYVIIAIAYNIKKYITLLKGKDCLEYCIMVSYDKKKNV